MEKINNKMPRKTDSLAKPTNLSPELQEIYDAAKKALNDEKMTLIETNVKTNSSGNITTFFLEVDSKGDLLVILMTVIHNNGKSTIKFNIGEKFGLVCTNIITMPNYSGVIKSARGRNYINSNVFQHYFNTLKTAITHFIGTTSNELYTVLLDRTDISNLSGELFFKDDINVTQLQEIKEWFIKMGKSEVTLREYYGVVCNTIAELHPNLMITGYNHLSDTIHDYIRSIEKEEVGPVLSDTFLEEIPVVETKEVMEEFLDKGVMTNPLPVKKVMGVKFS